jgi:CHAD domain-containing protein
LLSSVHRRCDKADKKVAHLVRADDFVAESLEEMVSKMPPSDKAHAEYFLGLAKRLRESGRTKMLKVLENEKEASA